MSVLRVWAKGFGRVIGLGPDFTSEAFDAFLFIVDTQLSALCIDLEIDVRDHLLPQLRILHDTIRRPALLLETLHALEPHHYVLLHHNPDSRPLLPRPSQPGKYVPLKSVCSRILIQLRWHTSRYGRSFATSFLSTLTSFTGV